MSATDINRFYDYAKSRALRSEQIRQVVCGILVSSGLNWELADILTAREPSTEQVIPRELCRPIYASSPDRAVHICPKEDEFLTPNSGDRYLSQLMEQADRDTQEVAEQNLGSIPAEIVMPNDAVVCCSSSGCSVSSSVEQDTF